MAEDKIAQVIDALESAFAQADVPDLYAGARWLLPRLQAACTHIEATQSRQTLQAYLESTGPSEAEGWEQLAQLFLAIYPLMRGFILQGAQAALDSEPAKKGPHVRIPPQAKRKVIDYISRLFSAGTSLGIAQNRAAQHFGYSLRSVERVWRERKNIAQQPFQSMDDVWKFLAKL